MSVKMGIAKNVLVLIVQAIVVIKWAITNPHI